MTKEEFRGFVRTMGLGSRRLERSMWAKEIGKHDARLGAMLEATVKAENDIYAYCKARLEGK